MSEASPRSPDVATPARILLVEDELNMARTLAKNLERAGYQVEHAPHGEAALARLESVNFDVVLT
ncbi:MAG TPA: response regulator, partial [Myxococcaceae bacterium]